MKQVNLSLATAKEMYNSGNESLKKFALENYTEKELTAKPLPENWEDIGKMAGWFIDEDSDIIKVPNLLSIKNNKFTIPCKELAEAMLALCQLLYLREIYNDGWQPDWYDAIEAKNIIWQESGLIRTGVSFKSSQVLSFKTSELRDKFYNNFKDLIEIAKPLL